MPALAALRLAVYLTVAAGVAALHLGGLVGAVGIGLFGAALLLGWWLRDRRQETPGLLRALVIAIALVAGLDLLYFAESAFDGFVRLLVLLVLLRLFTARTPRALRDAGLLAFFMLVASTAVTFSLGFLFVFVAFVAAGVAMLILAQDLAEAERAGGETGVARAPGAGRGFVALGLAASAASLLVTLALFFVIPRVGEATLALRQPLRRMLIGFTDRVELGAIGELETDDTVAMRVEVGGGPPPAEAFAHLRWRGITLERFDGRAWTTERPRRVAFRRPTTGAFEVWPEPREGGVPLRQAVFLEPIGTDAVFAAPHAVRAWFRSVSALVDDSGAIAVPVPSARLQYTVESHVGAEPWGGPLGGGERSRYLQLPPLSPRFAALAQQVAGEAGTDAAAAAALVRYLSRPPFRYTLTLERATALDPLEEFVFVRRAGNCEYFAAALVVMLRTLGIPARMVNGFQRGEWNPYGGYFLVRMGDAHSWVEAHVDGRGWITLDPSPREPPDAGGGSARVSLWLDALRVRWYRYIVSWSRQDQVQVAAAIGRAALTSSPWRLPGLSWIPASGLVLPAMAVVAGVFGWLAWRRIGPLTRAGAPPVPRFYRRALRALARRGLRPAPEETAREFARRVAQTAPALGGPLARVTEAYEAVRFGAAILDGRGAAEVDGALRVLASGAVRGNGAATGA